MPDNTILPELVPMLRDYLAEARTDQVNTKELTSKLEKTIEAMRDCMVEVKLQVKSLEEHSTSVTKILEARGIECGQRFDKMELKVEKSPSVDLFNGLGKEVESLKNDVKELKTELKALLITVTKWTGGLIVFMTFLTYIMPVLIKKFLG